MASGVGVASQEIFDTIGDTIAVVVTAKYSSSIVSSLPIGIA